MPVENMEEEGLQKIPDLGISQLKFQLQHLKYKDEEKKRLEDELKDIIKKDHMGKFYKQVCKDLKWPENKSLSKELEEENKSRLKKLDEDIKDAETNLGESEIREALLAKAEYLTKIGDKDAAIEAVRKTMEKTVGLVIEWI